MKTSQANSIFLTLVLVTGMSLSGMFLPARLGLTWAWVINLVLMFAVMGVIGLAIGKGFWAVFVDNRNMVSLSRFQVVLWTLVILSAFLTLALARVMDSAVHPEAYAAVPPADIQIPAEVLALMGISVSSSVAATLIKENKAQERVELDAKKGLSRSALAMRAAQEQPQFSDMFHAEMAGSENFLDMAKVQNFFFTVVAVLAYAVSLGAGMNAAAGHISSLAAFPVLSQGLITILGISHAGYLTSKVVSKPKPEG